MYILNTDVQLTRQSVLRCVVLKNHLVLVNHNVSNAVWSAPAWTIFIFIRSANTKPLFKSIYNLHILFQNDSPYT